MAEKHGKSSKGGKKRKKPAQKRYTAEMRWETNKKLRAKRIQKRLEKARLRREAKKEGP